MIGLCGCAAHFKYKPGISIVPVEVNTKVMVNVKRTEGFSNFPNLEEEIKDAIVKDLQKNVFPLLAEVGPEIYAEVDVGLLKFQDQPLGLLWLPFVYVGAPTDKLIGTAMISLRITICRTGSLIATYRSSKRLEKWTGLYYGHSFQRGKEKFIAGLALKEAMDHMKSQIEKDRSKIIQKVKETKEEFRPTEPPIVTADSSPPDITILSPAPTHGIVVVSKDDCSIIGLAKDQSEIAAVIVGVEEAELHKMQGGVKFSAKVVLREYEKDILIMAFDEYANVATKRLTLRKGEAGEPEQIKEPPLFADVDEAPKKSLTRLENGLCVIFGIEDYKYAPEASSAKRDAAIFCEYAKGVFGIPERNIYTRINEGATKGEFDKVFAEDGWLAKRLERGKSDIIFYFSGHGAPDVKTKKPYLIPWDIDPNYASTAVSLHRVYESLSGLGARSVTVFLDACFSGQSKGKMLFADARPLLPVKIEAPSVDITVFTASTGEQISSVYAEKKHGLFTYYLLKGLQGYGDSNGDREIRVGELFDYLKENVSKEAGYMDREQVPQLLSGDRERVLIKTK